MQFTLKKSAEWSIFPWKSLKGAMTDPAQKMVSILMEKLQRSND
jgi:hypothetical protein